MTISTGYIPEEYVSDGVDVTYPFTWRILAKANLIAKVTDPVTGVVTTLELNTDYTIADADVDTDDGGDVVLDAPRTSGHIINFYRTTSRTQLVNLTDSVFPAAVVTKVFDRLTMMIQELEYRIDQSNNQIFEIAITAGEFDCTLTHDLNNADVQVIGIVPSWFTEIAEVSRTVDAIVFEFSIPPAVAGTLTVTLTE